MEEASDPEVWMSVNHREKSEDEYPDLKVIKEACKRFEIAEALLLELLESYGGDHLKRQIVTALGTVLYYSDYGRDQECCRLMADLQYTVGGSTFVYPGLRQYLPAAEQEDLRLYYEELNESMVMKLSKKTSELLKLPPELREPFVTRMMELSNVRRAEFMTRLRRFQVSARGDGSPQIGDIMNISRAMEDYTARDLFLHPGGPIWTLVEVIWKRKDSVVL